MNTDDKRAQICGMGFIPVTAAVVKNVPGLETIQVSGEWTLLPVSSGEFKEKIVSGEVTEQELKAVVTDTGSSFSTLLRDLVRREGLVRLRFTNGSERVVGTDHFPVMMSLQESGSPAAFTLSFKRNSPEPAKFLKSF